jgi:ABC-type dipeptide/oligopeptide/nickel transport system permease subunit
MATAELVGRPRGRLAWTLRRFARQRVALAALAVLVFLLVVGAFAQHVAPYDTDAINLASSATNHAPELTGWHLFGTDVLGRDVLSRTLHGLRLTGEIGVAAALLAALIGVPLGALAGYYGGWLDAVLMRLVDLITAYPAILISLATIVYFKVVSPRILILVLGLYLWTAVARVVRGDIASIRAAEYVEAAHAQGASDARIFRSHLLPNVAGTILVAATAVCGQAILLDATIEFFSYGMPAAVRPSLGNLLADVTNSGGLGVQDYRTLGWWNWAFPGLVLALSLVCLNLVGDGLDSALNPRTGSSRRGKRL